MINLNSSLFTFISVFLGGGIGSIIRYSISLYIPLISSRIWLGTLFVNVVGAMLIFMISYKVSIPQEYRSFFRIGFLGGLTTFSTFSFEVVNTFKNGDFLESALILFLNIFFGIVVAIWVFR